MNPAPAPATVVSPEMCGEIITRSSRQSGDSAGSGSASKTSSAAPRSQP